MSKRTICIILGIWVALVPFFGLPGSWKDWIITLSGIIIAVVSYIRVQQDSSI